MNICVIMLLLCIDSEVIDSEGGEELSERWNSISSIRKGKNLEHIHVWGEKTL
jgi:hypothetical protein